MWGRELPQGGGWLLTMHKLITTLCCKIRRRQEWFWRQEGTGSGKHYGWWRGFLQPSALLHSLGRGRGPPLPSPTDIRTALSAFLFWTCPCSLQIRPNKLFRTGNRPTVHQQGAC